MPSNQVLLRYKLERDNEEGDDSSNELQTSDCRIGRQPDKTTGNPGAPTKYMNLATPALETPREVPSLGLRRC